MDVTQEILSEITTYVKYAKFDPAKNRRETWHELVTRNKEMHQIKFPKLKNVILANKDKSKTKIQSLIELKKHELESISELVVLSDSVEHFLRGMTNPIIKLYQKPNSSLKEINNLEKAMSAEHKQCIIIDSTQDASVYKKFNTKIIQIESENWSLEKNMHNSSNLFYTKYLKMINQLTECH